MLTELKIGNLGVIESAELNLGAGLNVITGETGAGKTMILSALTQTLGEKSDAGLIRAGATRMVVESCWRLAKNQQTFIGNILSESDVDQELVLGRSIDSTGKSRTLLNGLTSSNSVVSEIADELIQIFGQNDQRFLTKSSWQLQILDEFGDTKHHRLLEDYQKAFDALINKRNQIALLEEASTNWEKEKQEWTVEIAEFDEIAPVPNEDDEILEVISHKELIEASMEQLRSIQTILNDGEDRSLANRLNQLLSQLIKIDEFVDYQNDVKSFVSLLSDIEYRVANLVDQDQSEYSLPDLYSRKAAIASLIRKHALPLNEVIDLMQHRRQQLASDVDPMQQINELKQEEKQLQTQFLEFATKLSKQRADLASKISNLVTQELTALKMSGTEFFVEITPIAKPTKLKLADKNYDRSGADQIAFLISHGKQVDAKPIAKTASGGELSRIMLAIHVVLQATATDLTFVFDEVDAGIGGETAIQVGKRLKRLSERNQVIVVTHLPQVAAFADHHFLVQGDLSLGIKTSDVSLLNVEQRIAEIARMLGGIRDSESALVHAKELLALQA